MAGNDTISSATVGGIVGLQIYGLVSGCSVTVPEGMAIEAKTRSTAAAGLSAMATQAAWTNAR